MYLIVGIKSLGSVVVGGWVLFLGWYIKGINVYKVMLKDILDVVSF